jgi:lipopolysaccharide export system protein LptA
MSPSHPTANDRLPALTAILGLLLILTAPVTRALESDRQQPMLIEADKVEVDEGKSTSLYLGHVQVDQGSMRLLADQVTVHHRADRRPRYVIARGQPAFFKQQLDGNDGEMQAYANRMDYDVERDLLILTDKALVIQGKDRIASDRIVYDRAHSQVQAGGDSRVRIIITPEEENKKGGHAKPPAKPPTSPAPAAPVPRPERARP